MTAPAGAVVKLYVDLRADVEPGHMIVTQAGRLYSVISVRKQTRGKHEGRQHLVCVVMGDGHHQESIDALRDMELVVHSIHWYKRSRGKR